jgi:hypothetical protein
MNPDISVLRVGSFLFQCVKVVTKIISLAMIWMLIFFLFWRNFSKLSGSATSSQTPFIQKPAKISWKRMVALFWMFFAITFAETRPNNTLTEECKIVAMLQSYLRYEWRFKFYTTFVWHTLLEFNFQLDKLICKTQTTN